MIFGRKDKHDGRGSANNVSHAYVRWQEKLSSAVRQHTGTAYTMLDTESLVGLMTVVFVRNDFKGRVTDASITTMKRLVLLSGNHMSTSNTRRYRGMGGKYGNKVRLGLPYREERLMKGLVILGRNCRSLRCR